jgi:hypothetical protein
MLQCASFTVIQDFSFLELWPFMPYGVVLIFRDSDFLKQKNKLLKRLKPMLAQRS